MSNIFSMNLKHSSRNMMECSHFPSNRKFICSKMTPYITGTELEYQIGNWNNLSIWSVLTGSYSSNNPIRATAFS